MFFFQGAKLINIHYICSEIFIIFILKIFKNNINYDKDKLLKILDTINIVRENLYNNVNFQLSIEKIFITILR